MFENAIYVYGCYHTRFGARWDSESFTAKYHLLWIVDIAVYCAVNCFAIISGYVMIGYKIKPYKIIELWFQVMFYSVGITLLTGVVAGVPISLNCYVKALFPVLFNRYWYFTAYVMLFPCIPLLNALLEKLTKKQMVIL